LILLIGTMIFLFVMGVPIAFAMGISALLSLVLLGIPLLAVPKQLIIGIDNFVLLAVPLFMLTGN